MTMTVPETVLHAWALTGPIEPVVIGNINRTYRVGDTILQRLNPIFGPEVHFDIEAVTAHLESHGILTPRLIPTSAGELWTAGEDGSVWRLQTRIPGEVLTAGATAAHCREAGRLLGSFHVAVADLEHTFANIRPRVHDTRRHQEHLAEVLADRRAHPAYGEVEPVGRELLAALRSIPTLTDLPARIVHGDPKITNIVFDEHGKARALIDLDTFGHMTIPVELGDALRSWCNTAGEDEIEARFDLDHYEAALAGYASTARSLLSDAEVRAIATAAELIALELGARFCADALEESYFAWNPERFATASAHHLHRARGQWSLARAMGGQRAAMEKTACALLHPG
jgi:Ser/Thr protein kinase RdoA (MazF antagonist)